MDSGFSDAGVSAGTTYTYRVMAFNSGGASDYSNSAEATTPAPPAESHVGDLDGTRTSSGNNWQARITITVHDTAHGAVNGATVAGTWSGGSSGSASCTTNTDGQCM